MADSLSLTYWNSPPTDNPFLRGIGTVIYSLRHDPSRVIDGVTGLSRRVRPRGWADLLEWYAGNTAAKTIREMRQELVLTSQSQSASTGTASEITIEGRNKLIEDLQYYMFRWEGVLSDTATIAPIEATEQLLDMIIHCTKVLDHWAQTAPEDRYWSSDIVERVYQAVTPGDAWMDFWITRDANTLEWAANTYGMAVN
ncbi:uncharacterized protein I303_108043 [Kwoniella dejecticola CBS 10117]|uniref:Uncharacterized protein n=1 Tax=Kwoniella dejecticola CBS 10117 TaxID=1296121 RepID=A0A1A5ZWD2_9TREE|nr:uncharacterized protein I303_08034 [Kwoniella dejecticola CBS 10117]OBR82120.1 hypothetical protein I303_08034 [Kwoniella dejecticola CBS 10117]